MSKKLVIRFPELPHEGGTIPRIPVQEDKKGLYVEYCAPGTGLLKQYLQRDEKGVFIHKPRSGVVETKRYAHLEDLKE